MSSPSSAQLAVLYEHPQWFQPLFAALDRRGLAYLPVQLSGHLFDPAASAVPAPLILSRVAQSSFLREPEHPIFYAAALLDHWARCGARVLNGADVLAIDSSKARQLSLIASLGYAAGPMVLRRHLSEHDQRAVMGVSLAIAAVFLTPVTLVGLTVTLLSVTAAGPTVNVAVRLTEPIDAVIVTGVEEPTAR